VGKYIGYRIGESYHQLRVKVPNGNYNDITVSNALQGVINSVLAPCSTPVEVTYDNINHKVTMLLNDDRDVKYGELEVAILDDEVVASLFQHR